MKTIYATLPLALMFASCSNNTPTQDSNKLDISISKDEQIITGEIVSHDMPQYKSYYYNVNPTISGTATIQNNSTQGNTFTVKLIIFDPIGNSYEMDSEDIFISGQSTDDVILSGQYPSTIISGWFTAKIELWSSGILQDQRTKTNAFSAFKRAENYSTNTSSYSKHHWAKSKEICGENTLFGFNPDYAEVEQDGQLRLMIPSPQATHPITNQSLRKGGGVHLNKEDWSFLYGQFKATIKMDVNTEHSIGAFWLDDTRPNAYEDDIPTTIVMEIYKLNGKIVIDSHYYKNGIQYSGEIWEIPQNKNPYNNFYEYRIDWTEERILFYYDGILVGAYYDQATIPDIPLRLSYEYKMVSFPGPTDCNPSLPADTTYFEVDWAAW